MSATLTWSQTHGESNLQSTFSATHQGGIQLLNQYLTALSLFSDFPWQVCSFEGTTAPWYLTLKRKSNAPGRILFVCHSSAPGTTYNPQLGSVNWNAITIRAGWFPIATSDTPANILATSGDVFTNPASDVGLGNAIGMTTGTNNLTGWACEDGIVLRYGAVGSTSLIIAVGNLLDDEAGVPAGISFVGSNGSMDGISIATSVSLGGSLGGVVMRDNVSIQMGTGWTAPSGIGAHLRDNGIKRAWFLPRSLCGASLAKGDSMRYKFRQITYGPTPLAAYEELTDVGSTLKAISTYPAATIGYPWLTNFQV